MKKLFDKEAAKRFWNNIKKLFLRKPQNEGAAGKYLKYVSEDATEWADFPAFLTYKGTVNTFDALPKQANKGDVYTILTGAQAGAEYFYTGNGWEYAGKLIDTNTPIVEHNGDSTIEPNVLNLWKSPVTTLTITKGTDTLNKINNYFMRFTVGTPTKGESVNIEFQGFTLKWFSDNAPSWISDKTYEISIVNNYALWAEF